MTAQDMHGAAPHLPRLSPSRLEAWDRCPAAYRFEYVLRLPQPIGDQRPRLLGSVAHTLLEGYLQETLRTGARPPLARVAAIAARLLEQDSVPAAGVDLIREAVDLVTRWLAQWTVPVESVVAVEHTLAVDQRGTHVDWEAPNAFIRGRLDLVTVVGPHATVLDWKSGWVSEDEEGLRVAWAPDLYTALVWAWAPRLEDVSVEYHYLRTGRVARVTLTRAEAAETLGWARALAARIGTALAAPHDPGAFPPRPSTACATCPWVNRCPVGQAALEAMDEAAIPDDAEARRLASLLLVGEARVGRVRDRLRHYLQDREPLALDGMELGFFPTKGRYDPAAVFRAATEAEVDAWPLLATDSRSLGAFLKRQPGLAQRLTSAWSPTPPWFGHRKSKTDGPTRHLDRSGAARGSASGPAHEPGIPCGYPLKETNGRRPTRRIRIPTALPSTTLPGRHPPEGRQDGARACPRPGSTLALSGVKGLASQSGSGITLTDPADPKTRTPGAAVCAHPCTSPPSGGPTGIEQGGVGPAERGNDG